MASGRRTRDFRVIGQECGCRVRDMIPAVAEPDLFRRQAGLALLVRGIPYRVPEKV
jgi:hypothetical protein